jgi:hypothetical protein
MSRRKHYLSTNPVYQDIEDIFYNIDKDRGVYNPGEHYDYDDYDVEFPEPEDPESGEPINIKNEQFGIDANPNTENDLLNMSYDIISSIYLTISCASSNCSIKGCPRKGYLGLNFSSPAIPNNTKNLIKNFILPKLYQFATNCCCFCPGHYVIVICFFLNEQFKKIYCSSDVKEGLMIQSLADSISQELKRSGNLDKLATSTLKSAAISNTFKTRNDTLKYLKSLNLQEIESKITNTSEVFFACPEEVRKFFTD